MLIRLSGDMAEVPDGLTVDDLIQSKNLAGGNLIVELNGEIIRAEQWASTRLKPDDDVEMVQLVVGG